jgi:hypothetical protein
MAEAHQRRALGEGIVEPRLGARGLADLVQHVEDRARRAAMQRSLQGAEAGKHRRDQAGMGRRDHARGEGRGVEAVVGDSREIGVETLLEHFAGALAADHAQQVLRRGQRRIGRDRRQSFSRTEQRRQEHRQRAADEIVVRHGIGVRQHAEPDPQPFDRCQAFGGNQ